MQSPPKPRTHILIYLPRFVAGIESLRKRQTIRGLGKYAPGDQLKHRCWRGVPYRSRQREFLLSYCEAVEPIEIEVDSNGISIRLSGLSLRPVYAERFAVADGFESLEDMREFYAKRSITDFKGVVLRW